MDKNETLSRIYGIPVIEDKSQNKLWDFDFVNGRKIIKVRNYKEFKEALERFGFGKFTDK